MQNNEPVKYPIVFVTGIGQTWTCVRGDDTYRWNLFPRKKEILFDSLPAADRRRLIGAAGQIFRYLLTGRKKPDREKVRSALSLLLRFCRLDDNGNLPPQTDVHIYGARSFETLGKTDFYTGEPTDDAEKTLLDRMLRDIPCRDFMEQYGAENMYCFNYSPFTDLYTAADSLHKTLGEILAHRQEDKVILVPMSMGAAVTLAYLDAYYDQNGAKAENFIHHIVSVVGAWDGSEGFADLLQGRVHPQWDHRFYEEVLPSAGLPKPILRLFTRHRDRTNTVLRCLLDALLDGILLRSSAFLALVPNGRWGEMYAYIFSDARFAGNTRLKYVQAQTDRFIQAQKNLCELMLSMKKICGVRFSFAGGTGLHPGDESSDFAFMKLFACADRADTDGVLQVSSSFPFRRSDAYAGVPDAYTVFDRQKHEIGENPAAMQLIFDLISETNLNPPHFVSAQNSSDMCDDG